MLVVSKTAHFSYVMPARDVTLIANFKMLDEEPVEPDPPTDGMVTVSSIDYAAPGPHLRVTVTVVELDEDGKQLLNSPVAGAIVSIDLLKDGASYNGIYAGTTGSDGKVTFSYQRVPSGTYTTVVTGVDAGDLIWDKNYPEKEYVKR